MWTPDHDAELRRLGVETYISRHPGADVHEVLDRYLLLLDPEGRAALLREKNRDIEAGKWTPPRRKTGPKPAHPCPQKPRTVPAAIRTDSPQWPADTVERLRTMRARGLTAAEIAVVLGKTESAVSMKCAKLHIPSAASLTAQAWTMGAGPESSRHVRAWLHGPADSESHGSDGQVCLRNDVQARAFQRTGRRAAQEGRMTILCCGCFRFGNNHHRRIL